MRFIHSLFISAALAFAPCVQAGNESLVFTGEQSARTLTVMTDTALVLWYLRAQTSAEEYRQFEAELKKYGISEKSPMPKMVLHGNEVSVAGTEEKLNLNTLGDISNGKNSWRFNQKKTLFENYQALFKFLDSGNLSAGAFAFLPVAHAAEANAKDVQSRAMFALRGIIFAAIAIPLALAFSGASMTVGITAIFVAILLTLDHVLIGNFRSMRGIQIECVDQRLMVSYENAAGRQLAGIDSELGKQNLGIAEGIKQEVVCRHGSVMAALNKVVAKLGLLNSAEAMMPEKSPAAH